jgi:hypothetical protein
VQKKEMLEKEIMELTQQKINLQTVCTFICIQHLSHLAASPAGVAQQHRIMGTCGNTATPHRQSVVVV